MIHLSKKDKLLLFIIFYYLIPILYIYSHYDNNHAVSNIICNNNCKSIILFSMFAMSFIVILYELQRYNIIPFVFILFLLFGCIGLVLFDETTMTHYFMTTIVFISILGFMIFYSYIMNNFILWILFGLQYIFLSIILYYIHANIFYGEVAFILNFGLFYILLHFLNH
jgi:hypothetical protein